MKTKPPHIEWKGNDAYWGGIVIGDISTSNGSTYAEFWLEPKCSIIVETDAQARAFVERKAQEWWVKTTRNYEDETIQKLISLKASLQESLNGIRSEYFINEQSRGQRQAYESILSELEDEFPFLKENEVKS